MGVHFDPRDPATIADPHPAYRELREQDPVHRVPRAGLWFVSRHADARAVLQDGRVSARQGQRLRARRSDLPASMLTTDDPDHARLRGAVMPAFTPDRMRAVLAAIRPRIEHRLGIVAVQASTGPIDVEVVDEVARPVAVAALGALLGLSPDDEAVLAEQAPHLGDQLDPFADPAPEGPAQAAMQVVDELLARVLFDRLRAPRDDALSVLAAAYDADRLSAGEAVAAAGLLVVGGLEPLAQSLCGLLVALSDGDSVDGVPVEGLVEEVLRLESPIPFTARRARADLAVGGRTIARGDGLVVLLGSANRDADRFGDAEACEPLRRPNPHLAFGAGPHSCIGAAFTRHVMAAFVESVVTHDLRVLPGPQAPTRSPRAVPHGRSRCPLQFRVGDGPTR